MPCSGCSALHGGNPNNKKVSKLATDGTMFFICESGRLGARLGLGTQPHYKAPGDCQKSMKYRE